MKLHVREANKNDLREIARLQSLSWKDTYQGLLPDEFLRGPLEEDLLQYWSQVEIRADDLILVAEAEFLLGFIAIWCRPNPFIDNLHVTPKLRSRGVGARLMAAAARNLLAAKHNSAYLWVLEENSGAVRFYEKLAGQPISKAEKPVFGHKAIQIQFLWTDLTHLLQKAEACFAEKLNFANLTANPWDS